MLGHDGLTSGMETEKLVEKLEKADSIDEYLDAYSSQCVSEFSFCSCFSMFFNKKNLKKMDIIERSQIERVYAHEIIRGKKKPSRDKVIMMSIGLRLTVPEAQLLLKHSGFNTLTPKLRRDAIILFCIVHKLEILEINILLDNNELECLT